MRRLRVALAAALLLAAGRALEGQVPTIELRPGTLITRSVRVAPRHYRLAAPASLDSAAVTIRGTNITVDFAGATLDGAPNAASPDMAAGVGIRVDGGENVRITNARVRGYKVG